MRACVDQISDRIYRISTCVPEIAPGGFTLTSSWSMPRSRCFITPACVNSSRW